MLIYKYKAVYHNHAIQWFQQLREEGLKEDPRNERLLNAQNQETVKKVHELVAKENKITLKLMEYQLNVNTVMICQILN
jgi:transposase